MIRSQRDSPDGFEEVSYHIIKGPERRPHVKELQGSLGTKCYPSRYPALRKLGLSVTATRN